MREDLGNGGALLLGLIGTRIDGFGVLMLRVFPAACFAWLLVCVCLLLGVVWLPAVRYQNRRLEDESAPKPLLESEVDMVSILFFFC